MHNLGLKFGTYLNPGIPVAAVNQNTPIEGTGYHARDIADTSRHEVDYLGFGGNSMYYIDYSKPGAQAYLNSWANQLASWGVDFVKLDAVGSWDMSDISAWSQALRQTNRPIVLDISNSFDRNQINFWRQYSNAWRIDTDVQCYSSCSGVISWASLSNRFRDAPAWAPLAGPGGWNDLDSLNISSTADGISNDERQTYMTLWAIEASPLYAGDDLTRMDSYGLSLLTNDEVIAVDQRGNAAIPVSQSSNQQVWYANNGDGSYTVALFNLGSSTATVTANWSSLGFSGAASVRDLWSHSDLGTFNNSFSATLNGHASRLLKVVRGGGSGGTPTPTPTATSTPGSGSFNPNPNSYYKIVNRNSGKVLDVYNNSTADGAIVEQWTDYGTANQQWKFVATNNGYYKIINRNSGKDLDVYNSSTADGGKVDQWTDYSANNQQWNVVQTGSYYKIINRNSGKDLDVYNSSTADGGTVDQWTDFNANNQQWSIIQVS